MSDLVLARNCCLARMLPGGLPGKAKRVKRFERSNGLDTALYTLPFFFTNVKARIKAISSSIIIHQLQLIKLYHFKIERL